MEPKSKTYCLPEGWMERYQEEVRKLAKMSDLMKYMYIQVGREQVDNLHRELNNLTKENIHYV